MKRIRIAWKDRKTGEQIGNSLWYAKLLFEENLKRVCESNNKRHNHLGLTYYIEEEKEEKNA